MPILKKPEKKSSFETGKQLFDNEQKLRLALKEQCQLQGLFLNGKNVFKGLTEDNMISEATWCAIEAANKNDVPALQKALTDGADITFVRGENNSTILTFCSHSQAIDTMKYLIDVCGLNPAWRGPKESEMGFTLLHSCCTMGRSTMAFALLDHYPNLLCVDDQTIHRGMTCVQLAATNFHIELAESLINDYQADLTKCDFFGRSLLTHVLGVFMTDTYGDLVRDRENNHKKLHSYENFCIQLLTKHKLNAFVCTGGTPMSPFDTLCSSWYGITKDKGAKEHKILSMEDSAKLLPLLFKRFIDFNPNLAQALQKQAVETIAKSKDHDACVKARKYLGMLHQHEMAAVKRRTP